jgi:methylated-DNA-[protein]-cysteine S-methyltransferase
VLSAAGSGRTIRQVSPAGGCYDRRIMPAHSHTVFDTAIGPCGIAWGDAGIAGVQLPERDAAATRASLARRHPAAVEAPPTHAIRQAIDDIVRLLAGEPRDLSGVTLDMAGIPPFRRLLYAVLRGVPAGSTLSYGALAARLGDGCAARDVGEAMGRNPFPIIVPCHRVVGAGGRLGGFSAPGGAATKLRMLNIEQAAIGEAPGLFGALPLSAPPRRR